MFTDEAWDMPKVNWMPQGSFEPGEIPPTEDPDTGDMVQLPCVNRHWLPFVQGCLDQLRNPSTWIVADDDAMNAVLYRVARLKQMFGEWSACVSFDVRFDPDSCQLQKTLDGGATWEEISGWSSWLSCVPPQTLLGLDSGCTLRESFDGGDSYSPVPGWIDNFSQCVQEYTPVIGLPPNPDDQSPAQLACSISSYLAQEVVLASMSQAVTAIQDNLTLLAFGSSVVSLIPEFVLVTAGYDAVASIYGVIAEGTLSDYESALSDAALWQDVACAIFDAILTDGYVTPGNFSSVLSALSGITYSHPDVVSAITSYVSALGPTGLAQLSQRAGLVTGAACASCAGNWCFTWGNGYADFSVGWSAWSGFASYEPAGNKWVGVPTGLGDYHLYVVATIDPAIVINSLGIGDGGLSGQTNVIRLYSGGVGGTVVLNTGNSGNWTGSVTGADTILIGLESSPNFSLFTMRITGPGAGDNPFGDDNCV